MMNFFEFLRSRGLGKNVSSKPLIMGILNVTPDSFSDGGKFVDVDLAVARALQMAKEGAEIIDIGGESSGPGSKDVSPEVELARVIPVVKKLIPILKERGLRGEIGAVGGMAGVSQQVFLSVDTYKAEVARQAIEAGADMINDVTALRGDFNPAGDSKMAAVLAKYSNVPVVIMYSKDPTARTTRENVQYDDVIATVRKFLEERIKVGIAAGIARERFIIDPGMGAFVSMEPKYSLEILRRLREFGVASDLKNLLILIGASRKGFIGDVFGGLPVAERLEGSLACAAIAAMNGASILRVHDVKETRRVIDMINAIQNAGN